MPLRPTPLRQRHTDSQMTRGGTAHTRTRDRTRYSASRLAAFECLGLVNALCDISADVCCPL